MCADLDPAGERLISALQRFWSPFACLLPRLLRNGVKEIQQSVDFLEALQSDLPLITCKVNVIHAADDRLVSKANVDYIRNNCTQTAALNSINLKSGGHFLNKTKPREILKALEANDC